MEVTVGIAPTMEGLQPAALLLGYVTMAETQGADPCRRITTT